MSVAVDQASRNGKRIYLRPRRAKPSNNGEPGLMHVASLDCSVRQRLRHRHGAVEVVRMGRAERRKRQACLREARRKLGVRMHHRPDALELAIQQRVRVQVRMKA